MPKPCAAAVRKRQRADGKCRRDRRLRPCREIRLGPARRLRREDYDFQIKLETGLKNLFPSRAVAGKRRASPTPRTCCSRPVRETLLMSMDLEGVCVSSGSACSSGTSGQPRPLCHGVYDAAARSALRFSTGWATTDADIDAALAGPRVFSD